MTSRPARLAALLPSRHLDALLVAGAANLRYLLGYSLPGACLLVASAQSFLAAPEPGGLPPLPGVTITPAAPDGAWLRETLRASRARRAGYEAANVPPAQAAAWIEALKADFQLRQVSLSPADGLTEELRAVKDSEEIAAIRQATTALGQAWAAFLPALAAGQTEAEAAARLASLLRERGTGEIAPPLVAFGLNGANPEHQPSSRPAQSGEPILVRLACAINDYWAALARTAIIGPQDATFRRLHDLALGAQLAAVNATQPGLTGTAMFNLARPLLAAVSPDATFDPALGYGVGLEPRERPEVSANSPDVLVPGATVFVAPTLRVAGWGGASVGDVAEITQAGARFLSPRSP